MNFQIQLTPRLPDSWPNMTSLNSREDLIFQSLILNNSLYQEYTDIMQILLSTLSWIWDFIIQPRMMDDGWWMDFKDD